MDLQYAFDKLYDAMKALVCMDMSLQERVATGWVSVAPQSIQRDDVPAHLLDQLQSLQEKLVAFRARSDADSAVPDADAMVIAHDLFELFIDVTQLLPPLTPD